MKSEIRKIRFIDLLMSEKGLKAAPQGTLNGNLFHDKFSKMQLDYSVNYNKMLVLNTTEKQNKTFYGKLYGTGHVDIYGFLNNLLFEMNVLCLPDQRVNMARHARLYAKRMKKHPYCHTWHSGETIF